jgi:hypothetical protein
LWSALAAVDQSWKYLLPAALVILLAMAVIGGDAVLHWPWIAGWFLAAAPLAAAAVSYLRARRIAARQAFPSGAYLFARDMIDARDGACELYNFDHLTEVRPVVLREGMKDTESEVDFVFGRHVVGFRMHGKQTAQFVIDKFLAARKTLQEGFNVRDWDKVAALDPFFKARQADGWEEVCQPMAEASILNPFTQIGGKSGHGPVSIPAAVLRWGVIVGIVIAPALWFTANFAREAFAFSRARSADTVAAWTQYLKRDDPKYYGVVKQRYLPTAALRAAKKAGTAEALRDFLVNYGGASNAPEAVAALHKMYEDAAAQVKAETSEPARAVMLALLRWLEEHRTNVLAVRFGASSEFSMKALDDYIEQETLSRQQRNPIAPIGPSLSGETLRKREAQVLAALQVGFATIVSTDIVTLRKGGAFSGVVTGFDEPAITLTCFAEFAPRFIFDAESSKLFLALTFNEEFNFVVPGTAPLTSPFQVTFEDKVPKTIGKENLYDGMLRYAFEEAEQRIAASLFPKHPPERRTELMPVTQLAPAAPPAN